MAQIYLENVAPGSDTHEKNERSKQDNFKIWDLEAIYGPQLLLELVNQIQQINPQSFFLKTDLKWEALNLIRSLICNSELVDEDSEKDHEQEVRNEGKQYMLD